MNRREQAAEQTKENLQAAFWKLYAQKGMEKLSVKEVAAMAGYNRTTFYIYYQDLYDLLHRMEDEILENVKAVLNGYGNGLREEAGSPLMDAILCLLDKYGKYVSILLGEHGDPQFSARLKAVIWPFLMRWLIPRKAWTDYEMSLLSEFYLSGILAVITRWSADPQMTLQELVAFFLPIAFPETEDKLI